MMYSKSFPIAIGIPPSRMEKTEAQRLLGLENDCLQK